LKQKVGVRVDSHSRGLPKALDISALPLRTSPYAPNHRVARRPQDLQKVLACSAKVYAVCS